MTTEYIKQDRSFQTAKISQLVQQLKLDEKIALLSGSDMFKTAAVPRLNIPGMTDGPNGARGDDIYRPTPAVAIPCATCIAASFSKIGAEKAGKLVATEALARNAICLLAPTVNVQRSPLGGRAFESFSEDPTLSGLIAASYINGAQNQGVGATIKHFVGNDQEHERMGQDSIISDRPLREIYLRPFQIALKLSNPRAVMTGYNKLNGTPCSQHTWLLEDLLYKEWGFKGVVMSDWFGTYSVAESINAGCALEMPGPPIWRTKQLVSHLHNCHMIDLRALDTNITRLLTWAQGLVTLNPDMVYNHHSTPGVDRLQQRSEDESIVRSLATEGIVLLKNERSILPLDGARNLNVLIAGPNAKTGVYTGGGCAEVRTSWSVTPWTGLVETRPNGVFLDYALGCEGQKFMQLLNEDFTCVDGSTPGFNLRHYSKVEGRQASEPTLDQTWNSSELTIIGNPHPDLSKEFYTEIEAIFTAPITGEYEFGLVVTGRGWLFLDEQLVVDSSNPHDQERGASYFGDGTCEMKGVAVVVEGKTYRLRVVHDTEFPSDCEKVAPFSVRGLRVGAFRKYDSDEEMESTIRRASEADIAVLVVGLNKDWEAETFDRPNLDLPLRQNELIMRVAKAQPNTIVVVQGGSAIAMPWKNEVAGIVFAWYGGNETGNAIADVIYGRYNPSGRLPLSFPSRESDVAAALNYRSARGAVHYEEGIWVGYRHHNAKKIPPLFAFGHGLSYSSFEYSDLVIRYISAGQVTADQWRLEASVTITNTGLRVGDHSVHFYTSPPPVAHNGLEHPAVGLQAFEKVYGLEPQEARTISVVLDKYAISHWDTKWQTWRVELGQWELKVGIDAATMVCRAYFDVVSEMEWRGL